MDIQSIRQQFPQYNDLSDGDLLVGLHKRHYSDMHIRDFFDRADPQGTGRQSISDAQWPYWVEQVQRPRGDETEAQTAERVGGSIQAKPDSFGEGVLRSATQGLTFGAGDEIVAAGRSALDPLVHGFNGSNFSERFDVALNEERQKLDSFQDTNPVTAIGSEVAGAVAVPGLAGAKIAQRLLGSSSGAVRAATGATIAGVEGGIYGFNAGEGGAVERAQNSLSTGAVSAAVGGAAPLVGKGAKSLFDRLAAQGPVRRAIRNAPSNEQLRQQANTVFDAADQVTNLPRDPFRQNAARAIQDNLRKGMDPDLTPKASTVAQRFEDAATNPAPTTTFRELDVLRSKAGVAAGSRLPQEAAMGSRFSDAVNDTITNIDPALSREIGEARQMWGRMRRNETIQEIMRRAEFYKGGYVEGVRSQIRTLLKNRRSLRGFSRSEINLMEKIAKGGVGEKAGAFVRNVVGGNPITRTAAGFLFGGQTGAAASAAASVAGRAAGDAIRDTATQGRITSLEALIRAGGPEKVRQLSNNQQRLIEALTRRGARGVAAVGN